MLAELEVWTEQQVLLVPGGTVGGFYPADVYISGMTVLVAAAMGKLQYPTQVRPIQLFINNPQQHYHIISPPQNMTIYTFLWGWGFYEVEVWSQDISFLFLYVCAHGTAQLRVKRKINIMIIMKIICSSFYAETVYLIGCYRDQVQVTLYVPVGRFGLVKRLWLIRLNELLITLFSLYAFLLVHIKQPQWFNSWDECVYVWNYIYLCVCVCV